VASGPALTLFARNCKNPMISSLSLSDSLLKFCDRALISCTATTTATSTSTSTIADHSNQALGTLLILYGVTLGGAVVFWPSLVLLLPGTVTATIYYVTTPDSTPNGVLGAYEEGVDIAWETLRALAPPVPFF
jgi:hypothetical protein